MQGERGFSQIPTILHKLCSKLVSERGRGYRVHVHFQFFEKQYTKRPISECEKLHVRIGKRGGGVKNGSAPLFGTSFYLKLMNSL